MSTTHTKEEMEITDFVEKGFTKKLKKYELIDAKTSQVLNILIQLEALLSDYTMIIEQDCHYLRDFFKDFLEKYGEYKSKRIESIIYRMCDVYHSSIRKNYDDFRCVIYEAKCYIKVDGSIKLMDFYNRFGLSSIELRHGARSVCESIDTFLKYKNLLSDIIES
jgi:hypothetical protein